MPKKLYHINLNDEERQSLLEMTHKGTIKARQMKRAMILLKANEGLTDPGQLHLIKCITNQRFTMLGESLCLRSSIPDLPHFDEFNAK